jgi:hypothetical protein
MNKWFRRAVGSVGVAGGVLLLGAGTAHADNSVPAAMDPQQLHGLFNDLLTPAGGPNNQGLSLNAPDQVGLPTDQLVGALTHAPQLPLPEGPVGALPVPGMDLQGLSPGGRHALAQQVLDTVHPGPGGPDMIGDDLVHQSSYAGELPGLGLVSGLGAQPAVWRLLPDLTGGPAALGGLTSGVGSDGLLPAAGLPATVPPDGLRGPGGMTSAGRGAERPVAPDAAESLHQGLPALPSALPVGNLPIFDSLPPAPALPDLSALDGATGSLPGRHRAMSPLPGLDALPVSHGLPVADQVGGAGLTAIDATLNPASAAELPVFGAILRQGPTNGLLG